ncbi:hypothetical protein ACH4SK_14420 [Streptomyces inhibens]|uniref:hypothetical protein n=1 Tax=Streptomyces inhibens TaxID=2293571 RepID=UPI0037A83B6F
MTTPNKQHWSDPAKAPESSRVALAADGTVLPSRQVDDASPDPPFVATGRLGAEHGCPECRDLERGRKQAEAARDLSRVTDFNVLIVRHRRRHAAAEP